MCLVDQCLRFQIKVTLLPVLFWVTFVFKLAIYCSRHLINLGRIFPVNILGIDMIQPQ